MWGNAVQREQKDRQHYGVAGARLHRAGALVDTFADQILAEQRDHRQKLAGCHEGVDSYLNGHAWDSNGRAGNQPEQNVSGM